MDQQLKEILRQMIKYRFWIAVGLAVLFPMIAYAVSSGDIQAQADAAAKKVDTAKNALKSFGPGFKTRAYSQVVEQKTGDLSQVVDSTWRTLYERQAPLLDWPEGFEDSFAKWGRRWPDGVDPSVVARAIDAYKDAYPAYVTKVYNTIKPFNVEDGTGVVVAPGEAELLAPSTFTVSQTPTLQEVWDAQEKLWLQRTLLDVVAKVNGDAKDWDGAVIKKVMGVDVASASAMDQVWNSKKPSEMTPAEKLQTSQPIVPGNAPPPAAPADATKAGTPKAEGGIQFMSPPGNQYRLYPVYLSVLMDQNHLQDLFTALQNSPMAIQVTEVEMTRPEQRVKKPEKGDTTLGGAEMGGMASGGGGKSSGFYRPSRIGGSAAAMKMQQRNNDAMMRGFAQANAGGFGGFDGPQAPGATGVNSDRGKVSLREQNKTEKKADDEKDDKAKKKAPKGEPAFDPYYNLVEVRVNGIARFYNKPADAPAPAASPGGPATPPGPAAPADANASNPAPPAAANPNAGAAPAPAAEPGKAEPGKAEPAKDQGKADAPAAKDEPKADAKAKDEPKADAKAKDEPKADAKAKDEGKDEPKADAKPDAKAEGKGQGGAPTKGAR